MFSLLEFSVAAFFVSKGKRMKKDKIPLEHLREVMVSVSISKMIIVHPVSYDIFLTMTLEAKVCSSVLFAVLNQESCLYLY